MSGVVDDVDLIDLEAASGCVPRVSVPDATPEEQEHLLDVCPPKLEQKLSLTRRSHDNHHHHSSNDEADGRDSAGNVLVTLGHDQVVPVRKRIDVVSSDTIKRVRDITKNLEPMISVHASEDRVDFGPKKSDEEASYETREINDAFEFLSELDDNEGEQSSSSDAEKKINLPPSPPSSRSSSSSDENISSYPLEPTCFIQDKAAGGSFVFDNEAFESSPPNAAKNAGDKRPGNSIDFETPFKRLRSFTCSAMGFDALGKSSPRSCAYRKSWSEGTSKRRHEGRSRKRTSSEKAVGEEATKKMEGREFIG